MNPRPIAITLTTYYPRWYPGKLRNIKDTDKVRGDLAISFIKRAKVLDYQLVVVDGKSTRAFRKALREIGINIIFRRGRKRSPSRRQAFTKAAKLQGVEVIIFTEAEKVSLIDSIAQIVAPILKGQADIVVPKRNKALFRQTYPAYQYESEIDGNATYNSLLREHGLLSQKEDLDMFFGPRAFRNNSQILSLFMKRYRFHQKSNNIDPEEHSNTNFFPIVDALRKGLRVQGVEMAFAYPTSQKENEEAKKMAFHKKRKSQKRFLLAEARAFLQ